MKTKKEDPCKCSGNSIVRSKGEYTILVKRNSFRIKFDLPYCLWGTMYLSGQNFSTAVKDYLPVGVTCSSAIVANETIVFTYSDGVNTDKIIVQAIPTSLVSYPELLANLNTSYMKTELVYFCNNAKIGNPITLSAAQNNVLQAQPLFLQKLGSMGSKENELITPATRKIPNNTLPDVLELSMRKQDIRAQTVWVHKFAYIKLTEATKLLFYWQILFNDVVNLNEERSDNAEIKDELH